MQYAPDLYQQRLTALSHMWQMAQLMEDGEGVTYDIQFEFEPDQEKIVEAKLREMQFPQVEISKSENGVNLSVHLFADGTDGLRKIINFDRSIAKEYLVEIAGRMRLKDLEYQIEHPRRFAIKEWFETRIIRPKFKFQVPTTDELDEEVRKIYMNAGILLPDD